MKGQKLCVGLQEDTLSFTQQLQKTVSSFTDKCSTDMKKYYPGLIRIALISMARAVLLISELTCHRQVRVPVKNIHLNHCVTFFLPIPVCYWLL